MVGFLFVCFEVAEVLGFAVDPDSGYPLLLFLLPAHALELRLDLAGGEPQVPLDELALLLCVVDDALPIAGRVLHALHLRVKHSVVGAGEVEEGGDAPIRDVYLLAEV